jgi:hypothetical protein
VTSGHVCDSFGLRCDSFGLLDDLRHDGSGGRRAGSPWPPRRDMEIARNGDRMGRLRLIAAPDCVDSSAREQQVFCGRRRWAVGEDPLGLIRS